jgi:hypothetical protein
MSNAATAQPATVLPPSSTCTRVTKQNKHYRQSTRATPQHTIAQILTKFTDSGMSFIVNHLDYWPLLKNLDLSMNYITDTSVTLLLSALPTTGIEEIDFGNNPAISESLKEKIADQLIANKSQLKSLEKQTSSKTEIEENEQIKLDARLLFSNG